MRLDSAVSARHAVEQPGSPLSFFEFWPGWLFYTPVVIHWLMLGLRYGDFSLPTAANPRITTGGLCGESKLSILSQIGPAAQDLVAPACGVLARPDGAAAAEAAMAAAGLHYPVVAKPDIGCNGTGVRLVRDRSAMTRYLQAFPPGETVVLQHYVDEPNEAGIFYVRHPDETRGRITSVTIKQPPVVVGDGRSTLRALIMADERARLVPHLYLGRLADRLDTVPAPGETVQLVFVGNHCKGSIFRDGTSAGDAGADRRRSSGWRGRCRISSSAGSMCGSPPPPRCGGHRFSGDRDQRRGIGGDAHLGPVHQAAGCVADAVFPLRRGIPHRRGQPAARVFLVGGADDVPRLAEPAAADGALSAERLRRGIASGAAATRLSLRKAKRCPGLTGVSNLREHVYWSGGLPRMPSGSARGSLRSSQ